MKPPEGTIPSGNSFLSRDMVGQFGVQSVCSLQYTVTQNSIRLICGLEDRHVSVISTGFSTEMCLRPILSAII